MTEYDYSEEGYQRFLQTQNRVMNWVDQTNANRSRFGPVVHAVGQSTPSQVATRSRTRERSQSASYSYPQHQHGYAGYDTGGGRVAPPPPPRMQPTRSKTMDLPPKNLHYIPAHVYNNNPHSSAQPRSRSSSRQPSPPHSTHVSSYPHTPRHARSASKPTSPASTTPVSGRQYPYPSQGPPTTQPKSRHVRSSSAEPATRSRSRSQSYSGPAPPPPRPIPVPTPVSVVQPHPKRSNTMPAVPPKQDRYVPRRSYDTGGRSKYVVMTPPGARVDIVRVRLVHVVVEETPTTFPALHSNGFDSLRVHTAGLCDAFSTTPSPTSQTHPHILPHITRTLADNDIT